MIASKMICLSLLLNVEGILYADKLIGKGTKK